MGKCNTGLRVRNEVRCYIGGYIKEFVHLFPTWFLVANTGKSRV